ncbi:MAG: hypothetical protein IPK00_01780 [Deltaproteobacteria bacterium]|nr:hypothetical protein [Deltaproteobacteria bacterium]
MRRPSRDPGRALFRPLRAAALTLGLATGLVVDLALRPGESLAEERMQDEADASPPTSAPTSDAGELDDLMGGFEDDFDATALGSPAPDGSTLPGPEWISKLPFGDWIRRNVDLSGSIASGAVVSYLDHDAAHGDRPTSPTDPDFPDQLGRSSDFGGLTRLDLDGFLQLDVKLPRDWLLRAEALGWYDFAYRIKGRGDYGGPVLDVYEWQADAGEVYLGGPIHDRVDLTIGRKIVNWGRSDTFRIVDVVNPLDNKEPGLVDIEDLRRPRTMAKLDASSGPWTAEALAVLETRFDRNPPPGSDFYPNLSRFAQAPGLIVTFPTDDESNFSRKPGFAGRFEGNFSGWDFGLFGAWVDETSRVLDVEPATGARLEGNRYGMVGAAGNVTRGAWLAKFELAWLTDVRMLRPRAVGPLPFWSDDKQRLDSMLGLEWYGPDSLTVALEIVNRQWLDLPKSRVLLEFFEQSTFETGLRISRPFFRERLDVTLLGVVFGERAQDGGLVRASGEWELTDSWKVEGGWLAFIGGPDKGIGNWDDNDRVYLELKYSF